MNDTNKRRDFLFYSTTGVAVVGVGAMAAGLGQSLLPSADEAYQDGLRIDLDGLQVGQQITLLHYGKPLFLRHRTQLEIDQARATSLDDLIDPFNHYGIQNVARSNEPATDENRSIDPEGRFVIFAGICTHLGCVPIGDGAGDYNGWFCPCHAAHFDASGRTRKGPAPYNLAIPNYEWNGGSILTLLTPDRAPPMSDEQLNRVLYGQS